MFSPLNIMLVLFPWPWSFQVKDVGLCVKNLGSAECMRLHEAQGLGSCWLGILYTLLLWRICCWPYGLEGCTVFEVTGPFYPCVSMPQPRPSVVRAARWRTKDTLQSLVVSIEPTAPSQLPVPCSLPPVHRDIRQEGRKLCVGTDVLKGRCSKDSLSQSLVAASKKKATVFQ